MIYRDNNDCPKQVLNIALNKGGIGDLIGQLPAIEYILNKHVGITINLFTHNYAVDLCKHVFRHNANINMYSIDRILDKEFKGEVRSPYITKVSNIGLHITEHAFMTLLGTIPDSTYLNYIHILPVNHNFQLPEKYVVITTGYTSDTRRWLSKSINEVVDYIVKYTEYTPVFLGKKYTQSMVHNGKEQAIIGKFDDIYFTKGINLIDKTTLLEAHSIMSNAACVIGLDNGLLHLAGMSDVPIVGGFTTVNPEHRMPYRNDVKGYNFYEITPDKNLGCRFCQSQMSFASHDFRKCLYDDYACLELLPSEKWISVLKVIL